MILSTQNDFDSLLVGENDTVNVIVSEAVTLPNLNPRGSFNRSTAGSSIFGNNLNTPTRVGTQFSQSFGNNGTLASASSSNRFPSIFDQNYDTSQYAQNSIRWKKGHEGQILGQGAFGIVTLGLNIDTGELMAVKQMAIDEVSGKELSTLENEINLLRNIRHPNIVRYIGTEISSSHLSIFLEYVPGGSLKALIDKFGSFEESVVRSYTRQLLLGLEYLHRYGVAHRDIKGANCLVGNDGVIKLADFGNSKSWRVNSIANQQIANSGDIKGTPCWMAPEVIRDQGGQINWKKADVWSLACTTLEMSTGKPPWSQFSNSVTILYHIACQDTLPDYPVNASPELTSFLSTCLARTPSSRPDATSLLLHPFVASMLSPGIWSGQSHMGFAIRPSTVSVTPQGKDWFSTSSSSQQPMGNSSFGMPSELITLAQPNNSRTASGSSRTNIVPSLQQPSSSTTTPRMHSKSGTTGPQGGQGKFQSNIDDCDDSVVSDITLDMFKPSSSTLNATSG